jgi:hypothetical protein
VLKEWAKTQGYTMYQRRTKRRSLFKTGCGIAGYRSTSASVLAASKISKLKSGEIHTGKEFFPIKDSKVSIINLMSVITTIDGVYYFIMTANDIF